MWFTSDHHFLHEGIISHCNRPFGSLDEMTEAMIQNYNAVVSRGDLVYFLGDFALSYGRKHEDPINMILGRLNGSKHLIFGNHDRVEVLRSKHWVTVSGYKEQKVDLGGVHKQRIVMCHYPFMTWNQKHRGSWHLHGHCHGNLRTSNGKMIDVGVDVNGYAPVSLEQVRERMAGLDDYSLGGEA